jgi:NAD(P)H-dependent FMN reductase
MRILAISGSLRAAASNTAVLQAATKLAPADVKITLYDGLSRLPHFNPDLEGNNEISLVTDFRSQIKAADGVLISSPEYAHGVPGVLKNALDWVVGSGELVAKPVALINASPRAVHAQASLTETLITMSAKLVVEAFITVPVLGRKLDAQGIRADPEISGMVSAGLVVFARAINCEATCLA